MATRGFVLRRLGTEQHVLRWLVPYLNGTSVGWASMGFRRQKQSYAGYKSWREWRDASAAQLCDAGVPTIALESERNWDWFMQEAEVSLIGGAPFEVAHLTETQVSTLGEALRVIGAPAEGGDLINELKRRLASQ